MAFPANDVSTRWFKEKLFPTDCWPIEDTTFTGYSKINLVSPNISKRPYRYTFKAMYDLKIDSYQPNDNSSTILLTSAPSRDRSSSGERTPSAKGMNRFSRQTAT